jgi:hypothetical protein
MSQFEYISVFASIILGLGLAHLLSGAIQQIYLRRLSYQQLCYSVLALFLIVLNWWGLFAWKDGPSWSLLQFFVVIAWSLSMFGCCVALYPPGESAEGAFETHKRTFLWLLLAVVALDVAQTAMHGALFSPPSYPWFMGHYAALTLAAIFVRSGVFQAIVATYLTLVLIPWGFQWTLGAF